MFRTSAARSVSSILPPSRSKRSWDKIRRAAPVFVNQTMRALANVAQARRTPANVCEPSGLDGLPPILAAVVTVLTLLGVGIAVHAGPPRENADDIAGPAPDIQDVLLLGPLEPIRLRLRIE